MLLTGKIYSYNKVFLSFCPVCAFGCAWPGFLIIFCFFFILLCGDGVSGRRGVMYMLSSLMASMRCNVVHAAGGLSERWVVAGLLDVHGFLAFLSGVVLEIYTSILSSLTAGLQSESWGVAGFLE